MSQNNKMLIDATHPEETRVVVLRDGRVEEFDFESAARKPLRGNIYLAKVTRVEPSLQAAFVEYGGNRHGFLAFNEIHPDYYQIPVADRQALLDEEAAAEAQEEAEADARAERRARGGPRRDRSGGRGRRDDRESGDQHGAQSEQGRDDDHGDDHDDGQEHDHGHDAHQDDGHASARGGEVAEASGFGDATEMQDPSAGVQSPSPDEPRQEAASDGLREPVLTEIATHVAEPAETEGEDRAEIDQPAPEPADAPLPVGLVEDVGVHEVDNGNGNGEAEIVEEVGSSEDAMEEVPMRPRRRARSYKIQEVIKRRQVILVQVVKEERGNKGAALTTYLSLAGRYTVLMPNTARGGGISRKITQPQDRKRLKAIAAELDVPDGMGLIIRTAGAARTKQEIKRDFEYLLRLWENVREMTLQSVAPNLVYEEGDLIKRSIRDHYTKDVDEILVAGDAAFHEARDFMGMLMPSHAKNVIEYREPEPLFTRFQIERQLNAMFSPFVTLRSGGYLVVNQTEALVAIDVNSGKSTREFSIEETALNTNLEASDEIARQLKLRDLAGLIVIDFIDMEEKRNNRSVERRLKDALRFDRARIQVGRISHFGLLEMSRQRLRTGVLEGSTSQCPHCQGTGMIRSVESVALAVLRGLEDALMGGPRTALVALTTAQVALYILNNKRAFIIDMEKRSGVPISVQANDKMQGANFVIERGAAPVQPPRRTERSAVSMDWGFDASDNEPPEEAPEASLQQLDEVDEAGSEERESRDDHDGDRRGRGRRRRRRGRRDERGGESDGSRAERPIRHDDIERGSDGEELEPASFASAGAEIETTEGAADDLGPQAEGDGEGPERGEDDRRGRRRRRGRRGGRRGGRERLPGEADAVAGVEEGSAPQTFGDEPPLRDDMPPTETLPGHGVQPDVEFYAVLPETQAEPVAQRRPDRGPRRERARDGWRERRQRVDRGDAAPSDAGQGGDTGESRTGPGPASESAGQPSDDQVAGLGLGVPDVSAPQGSIGGDLPQSNVPQDAGPQPESTAPAEPLDAPVTKVEHRMPEPAVTEAQPARPRRSNGDPTAITPKLERVVVKADETTPSETAPAPSRKGWWQRKTGM